MYAAAPAAINLSLTAKKAIFVNNVEIMKLGNLVPNFESTSRDFFLFCSVGKCQSTGERSSRLAVYSQQGCVRFWKGKHKTKVVSK